MPTADDVKSFLDRPFKTVVAGDFMSNPTLPQVEVDHSELVSAVLAKLRDSGTRYAVVKRSKKLRRRLRLFWKRRVNALVGTVHVEPITGRVTVHGKSSKRIVATTYTFFDVRDVCVWFKNYSLQYPALSSKDVMLRLKQTPVGEIASCAARMPFYYFDENARVWDIVRAATHIPLFRGTSVVRIVRVSELLRLLKDNGVFEFLASRWQGTAVKVLHPRPPTTALESASIMKVMTLLWRQKCSAIPLLSETAPKPTVVDVISLQDVVQLLDSKLSCEDESFYNSAATWYTKEIREGRAKEKFQFTTMSHWASISAVVDQLLASGCHRAIFVNELTGDLVGVVTVTDILRVTSHELREVFFISN